MASDAEQKARKQRGRGVPEMPGVSLIARFHALCHLTPLLVWTLITCIKICVEFMLFAMRSPFGEHMSSGSREITPAALVEAGLRLTTFVLVMAGLLGVIVVMMVLCIDVMASKTKPLFVLRARLHHLASAKRKHSWLAGLLFFLSTMVLLPTICGVAMYFTGQFWVDHKCWRCYPGAVACTCVGELCAPSCDLSLNVILASLLILSTALFAFLRTLPDISSIDKHVAQTFAQLDGNYSGVITLAELRESLTPEQSKKFKVAGISGAESLMRFFDDDGDQELDFAEFRLLVQKYPELIDANSAAKTTRSSWTTIIESPELWAKFVARLLNGFVFTSVALLGVILLVADSGLSGLASFLVICCIQTLLLSAFWLMCINFHTLLNLTKASAITQLGLFLLQVGLPALIVMNVEELAAPFPMAMICLSIFTIIGLGLGRTSVTNEFYQSRAFKIGGMVLTCVFCMLGFLFVSSAIQVLADARQELPDVFKVETTPGDSGEGMAVHTVIGGISIAVGAVKSKTRSALPPNFGSEAVAPTCGSRVYGMSTQDSALMAQMAYITCAGNATGPLEKYRATFFPDFEVIYGCEERDTLVDGVGQAVFYHLYSEQRDLHVISIRGTHVLDLVDAVQDVDLWIESVVFNLFGHVFAGLRLWPLRLIADLMLHLSQIDGSLAQKNRFYYSNVVNYAQLFANKRLMITGHSLGGGLAKIVGAKLQVPAVAISGPGIVDSHLKFGVKVADINRYIVNLVPSQDVVAALGMVGGTVHNIECLHRPDVCHQPFFTICHLHHLCGAAPDSAIQECDFQVLV